MGLLSICVVFRLKVSGSTFSHLLAAISEMCSVGAFCQAAVSHTCRSHWVVLSQRREGMGDWNRGSDKDENVVL